MNLEQAGKIVSLIIDVWPSFLNGREPEGTVRIWQRLFAEDEYQTVGQALYAYISMDNKGFPPSPGQIRALMADLAAEQSGEMTESEAWALVDKATRRGAYNSEEEFAKLPPTIQRCVGDPKQLKAWSQLEEDEVQTVIASNFKRSYRAITEKQSKYAALPQSLRDKLPGLASIGLMPYERKALPPQEKPEIIPTEAPARSTLPDWMIAGMKELEHANV